MQEFAKKEDLYEMAADAFDAGDLSRTEDLLLAALKLSRAQHGDNPHVDHVHAIVNLARVYTRAGAYDAAAKRYDQATTEAAQAAGVDQKTLDALLCEQGQFLSLVPLRATLVRKLVATEFN